MSTCPQLALKHIWTTPNEYGADAKGTDASEYSASYQCGSLGWLKCGPNDLEGGSGLPVPSLASKRIVRYMRLRDKSVWKSNASRVRWILLKGISAKACGNVEKYSFSYSHRQFGEKLDFSLNPIRGTAASGPPKVEDVSWDNLFARFHELRLSEKARDLSPAEAQEKDRIERELDRREFADPSSVAALEKLQSDIDKLDKASILVRQIEALLR
jgi:hypothetical protein